MRDGNENAGGRRHSSSEYPLCKSRRRSWYRRKRSIAPTLLDYEIRSRQYPGAKHLLAPSLKIRPLGRGLFVIFGHNASDPLVAVTEFDGFPCPEPCFQALGVPKLAHVERRHKQQCATLCGTLSSSE